MLGDLRVKASFLGQFWCECLRQKLNLVKDLEYPFCSLLGGGLFFEQVSDGSEKDPE